MQLSRPGATTAGRTSWWVPGWTILNVWYEDIVEEHLWHNQLVADVARAMGIRLRIRSGGFDARRNVLRMQLIPAFKRYAPALAR